LCQQSAHRLPDAPRANDGNACMLFPCLHSGVQIHFTAEAQSSGATKASQNAKGKSEKLHLQISSPKTRNCGFVLERAKRKTFNLREWKLRVLSLLTDGFSPSGRRNLCVSVSQW
jgi:hypothetical protein